MDMAVAETTHTTTHWRSNRVTRKSACGLWKPLFSSRNIGAVNCKRCFKSYDRLDRQMFEKSTLRRQE